MEDGPMLTGILPLVSPRMHRFIDQLTFPGLLAASALMTRVDGKAAALFLLTAGVEGAAHVTTDYAPAVVPLMDFKTHNQVAIAHGMGLITLGLTLPGLTRLGRLAVCTLGTMPITLAAISDVRDARGRASHFAAPGR
jgi:hypothetical protein